MRLHWHWHRNYTEEVIFFPILAAMRGQVQLMRLYVELGVDLDIQDQKGRTALIRACEDGHYDIV